METSISKIISGGQTGADMAGTDFAIRNGFDFGGTVPRGWRQLSETGEEVENSAYFSEYPGKFTESASRSYAARTVENAKNGDGTLVIADDVESSGTAFTYAACGKHGKPHFTVVPSEFFSSDGSADSKTREFADWVSANGISVLNVAGNSERSSPGIYGRAYAVLERLFGTAGL